MAKITPKSVDAVFDDSVLAALPSNDKLAHGVGMAKRNDNPDWRNNLTTELKNRWANNPEFVDKITEANKKAWLNEDRVTAAQKFCKEVFSDPEVVEKRNKILTEVRKTEEWKNAQRTGAQKNAEENKEWYEKTVAKNRAIANDPERIRKIKESKQRIANDPVKAAALKEKLSKNRSRKVTTPLGTFSSLTLAAEAHKIATNSLRRHIQNGKEGYWMEPDSKGTGKTTGKPIMTPTGVFPSKSAAAAWATKNGLGNATKKIDRYLKEFPDQFYYISKEEYIMLTGKDI